MYIYISGKLCCLVIVYVNPVKILKLYQFLKNIKARENICNIYFKIYSQWQQTCIQLIKDVGGKKRKETKMDCRKRVFFGRSNPPQQGGSANYYWYQWRDLTVLGFVTPLHPLASHVSLAP